MAENKIKEKADEILEKIKKAFRDFGYKLSGTEPDEGDTTDFGLSDAQNSYDLGVREELIEKLREMEAQYQANKTGVTFPDPEESIPPSLNEKPIDYVGKTEEEIVSEAETALKPGYTEDVNAATEKYQTSTDKLENQRAELEAEEAQNKRELEASTAEAHREYTGDMILQGLVNSSIMSYGNELIERAGAEAKAYYDKTYDIKYNEIRDKITEAETVYNNALREYDLNYAADLEAKIAKLKSEEEARIKEINEYNRKLQEREAAYQQERAALLEEMQRERAEAIMDAAVKEIEFERVNGVSAEKQAEYAKRIETAKEFYNGYSKSQAHYMLLLSADELMTLLGSQNYLALINWNMMRSE